MGNLTAMKQEGRSSAWVLKLVESAIDRFEDILYDSMIREEYKDMQHRLESAVNKIEHHVRPFCQISNKVHQRVAALEKVAFKWNDEERERIEKIMNKPN